jgi:hypothetical protein
MLWRREEPCHCSESNPGRPAFGPSLYRLSYPGSNQNGKENKAHFMITIYLQPHIVFTECYYDNKMKEDEMGATRKR